MKAFKKTALGAAMALALAGGAQAVPINVGGVIWDPDALTDFTSQSINMRQFINTTTGELSGFGIVTAMNGSSTFCAVAGCELTFQFSGYMPIGGTIIPGVGSTITYTGGSVNFYVGAAEIVNPANYNSLTWANTGNGTLWLSAIGHGNFLGTALDGGFGTYGGLSGLGLWDVVAGGLATSNFDTNTQPGGSDFRFSTSLTYFHISDTNPTDVSGTGNVRGNSIPEPGSLALAGISLLGLAALRRRQMK